MRWTSAGCISERRAARYTHRRTAGIRGQRLSGICPPCSRWRRRRCHDPGGASGASSDAGPGQGRGESGGGGSGDGSFGAGCARGALSNAGGDGTRSPDAAAAAVRTILCLRGGLVPRIAGRAAAGGGGEREGAIAGGGGDRRRINLYALGCCRGAAVGAGGDTGRVRGACAPGAPGCECDERVRARGVLSFRARFGIVVRVNSAAAGMADSIGGGMGMRAAGGWHRNFLGGCVCAGNQGGAGIWRDYAGRGAVFYRGVVIAGGAVDPGGVAAIVSGLAYGKAVESGVDGFDAAVDGGHLGQPGAAGQPLAQLFELFGLADGVYFNSSVVEIANVAGKAQLGGCALSEEPEADALHASADEVPAGDSPARSGHVLSMPHQGARFVTDDTTPSRISTLAISWPMARKRMRSI